MLWLLRYPALLFLLGLTVLDCGATFAHVGAQSWEHPDGISLRQDSTGSGSGVGGFFLFYNSRSHYGGGISGGK